MKYCEGNILDSGADIICQQVNCKGVMGSGLAKQIADRYPIVVERYIGKCKSHNNGLTLLGECFPVHLPDGQIICNIFGQNEYGKNKDIVYTNYTALKLAFNRLGKYCINTIYSRVYCMYKNKEISATKALSMIPNYSIDANKETFPEIPNYLYNKISEFTVNIIETLYHDAKEEAHIINNIEMADYLKNNLSIDNITLKISVAIPYNMGCGLGNGSWEEVLKIIKDFEAEYQDFIDVQIWRL